MTQIKVDTIADAAGTGAADFADGITIAGGALSALNTAEYYSSGTEPTSPKNGAIWWDTTNEKVMVYIADEFKEVELGASAAASWTVDLSNVSYDSVSFSTASQTAYPYDLVFNADGTKMYVGSIVTSFVFQYSLSTAYDISTLSYDNVSFTPNTQGTWPIAMRFNSDGTKMFIISFSSKIAFQYSLSTAYNIGTASYDSVSFSFSSQGQPFCMNFNADGTKLYMIENTNDKVHQYSLTTGFDLSTTSYDNVNFSVSSQDTNPTGFFFNPDGTKMYMVGSSADTVFQYSLSTGFDLSTASYDSVSFSVASQEYVTNAVIFSADGTKMYITGEGTDTIYQYSTGL